MSVPSKLFSLIKPNEEKQNVTEQELNCYVDAISKFATDEEETTNEFKRDEADKKICYAFLNALNNIQTEVNRQKPYTYNEVENILDKKLKNEENFSKPLKLDFNKFFLNLVIEDLINYSKNSNEQITMQPLNQNNSSNIKKSIDTHLSSTKNLSMFTSNTSEITPLSFTIQSSIFHKDYETELYKKKQIIKGGFKRPLKTKRRKNLRK
jgi:hypothetical protein